MPAAQSQPGQDSLAEAATSGSEFHINTPEPVHRRNVLVALLVSLRPKQWTKNVLLFAALLFTIDSKHAGHEFLRSFEAFLLFCLLSGSTYLINDVVDVAADRHHPIKRFRPIAAGEISNSAAIGCAAAIAVVSLGLAFGMGFAFGVAALMYFALTLSYTLKLKHVVLLDLLVLASGFVLRAVAGAWAINVAISPWLIICTMLLALFLGIAKRRGELVAVLGGRISGRGVIGEYSADLLDQMSTIVTSALLMSYSLYTIQSDAASKHKYLIATIPFVLYGIFRYLYLVHMRNMGESPDELVLKDKPLIWCIALWAVATAVIILVKV